MSNADAVHPDDVLEALIAGCTRQQKVQNLKLLHALCGAQHSGSKDFSLAVIGRLWEAGGGIKARALYNAPSDDYRTLIKAWEAYSGPAVKAAKPSGQVAASSTPFLARIEDPAVRALAHAALIERDKLRAEVNLLKSLTVLNLDRAPALASPASRSKTGVLAVGSGTSAALTPSERDALERAISPLFLSDQGWSEGANGEVQNERGRRIFEAGFVRAIRKVLG